MQTWRHVRWRWQYCYKNSCYNVLNHEVLFICFIILFFLHFLKRDCPCHRDERNHNSFSLHEDSRHVDDFSWRNSHVLTQLNFKYLYWYKHCVFYLQQKNTFLYLVLIIHLQDGRFPWWTRFYDYHRVWDDSMSVRKVSKAFRYAFNVSHST